MAHLLKKFGESALKPRLVNAVWHKPNISKRVAAVLKRSTLLQGQCAIPGLAVCIQCRFCHHLFAFVMTCTKVTDDGALHCALPGREWAYPEPEKPQHPTKPRGPFGQYKKPKGHKHEKLREQRCAGAWSRSNCWQYPAVLG